MNFLYRTAAAPPSTPDPPRVPEQDHHKDGFEKPFRTLEGLIAEDPHMPSSARPSEDGAGYGGGAGDSGPDSALLDAKSPVLPGTHTDVAEDEGWITIPRKALPENWNDVSEMAQLQPLDRSFLFPGEQIHILACLSASKQDVQVISPFKLAALMSKNGNSLQHSTNKSRPVSANDHDNGTGGENGCQDVENNQESVEHNGDVSLLKHDNSVTQTLLQIEDHKQQIELILQRFRESNFFVRIAESDEPLWSKKRVSASKMVDGRKYSDSQEHNKASKNTAYNTVSDKGIFYGSTSGGVARDTVKCYPLQNGDIVVVLQVNVGVNKLEDPVLEILQFEKCMSRNYVPQNLVDGLSGSHDDPCRELLSWLLPLDRTLPPRSLSPPTLNPSVSHKQSYSSSSSQIFNLRSYSMPSHSSVQPPNNTRPPPIYENQEFMPEKPAKTPDTINDGQLSFRGVPLEPDQYSVRCGLEGVYLPGKRWRRKVEIIQPIEVHSFAAKCTVENLLCVIVKNVAPAHAKDIVVFIDAITIVFEEASKGGAPLSLPIAGIEVGHGHSLPNLALRRGEEHSFILKPAALSTRDRRTNSDAPPALSLPTMTGGTLNTHMPKISEQQPYVAPSDQYAVLVSYRCNYSESKLLFKQATSWRPCAASDLMISVSSELSLRNPSLSARVPQLPVQVLTLEATNMTSENLMLTVLAPEASGSSSVVSLNSSPTTPNSPYDALNGSARSGLGKHGIGFRKLNSVLAGSPNEGDNGGNRTATASGCTHLWLQSAVPLGCVPARSSTTVKLELLALTDGIITLDTLQITTREKGLTYIPEHSLEIHATSGYHQEGHRIGGHQAVYYSVY